MDQHSIKIYKSILEIYISNAQNYHMYFDEWFEYTKPTTIYRPLHAFVNYELIGRICLSGIQPATGTIELDVPLCSAPGQFKYRE